MAIKKFETLKMAKFRVNQQFYPVNQYGRFNFQFFNFYGPSKIPQNWHFLRFFGFFDGFFDIFAARYLVNRTSYEKSKLTLMKSKFCEESKKEVKKPLRPTLKKLFTFWLSHFDVNLPAAGEKIQKPLVIFCSEFPGDYDKIKT